MKRWFWMLLASTGMGWGLTACVSLGRVTPYDLGVALYDKGELAAATEHYKEALAQNPEHIRARFNLAVIYHDQHKYAAAREQYWRILQQTPTHARSLVNLADIAVAEGDPEQAYVLLLRAVDAEPDRAYPYSYLGYYLQEHGRLAEAQTAYERALAIEEDALTHYRLGMLWLHQGNASQAGAHFTKAVKRDPDDHKSLYQLALLATAGGKTTDAVRYLQRLTRLTPHHAEVFLRLGKLYMQLGQYSTAAVHLWEARDLQPGVAEVEQLLLQVYEHLLRQQQELLKRQPSTGVLLHPNAYNHHHAGLE
jgi:tetratricopeptide (TPR) repeat protein